MVFGNIFLGKYLAASRRLENLSRYINSLMGDNIGEFLISTELQRMNYTVETFQDEDYKALLQNLSKSFESILGQQNANWLLEELNKNDFFKMAS